MVEIGYYSVSDGVLTMHDESGKPGKTYRLSPDENERAVASRLTLERAYGKKEQPFNRPLNYSRRCVSLAIPRL
jgi:hypothetical protein